MCREEVIKAINYLFEHVKNYEDETIIENILNIEELKEDVEEAMAEITYRIN